MHLALLCAFLLLSSQVDASTATRGDLCRIWVHGKGSPVAAFHCPRLRNAADAKFCCGTCSAPYCCSSRKARFDQQQCSTSSPGTVLPPTKKPRRGWAPGFVILIMLPVCLFIWVAVRYCKKNRWMREAWGMIRLAARPFPLVNRMGSTAEAPPSQDVEGTEGHRNLPQVLPPVRSQHANAGNLEDEYIVGPVVHRNVPGLASGPVFESTSSADQ